MLYTIKDEVFERIYKKIAEGTFKMGKNCSLTKYYFKGKSIDDFPLEERTPEVCVSLMDYNDCRFSDVPENSRTREFFIASFSNNEVNDYIKNHLDNFDREFFKDLIASNEYATRFDRNCFSIMPEEYIDEEMCSLAIIRSLDWSNDKWFYSVCDRKPEALTADLWKLGARLYSRLSGDKNKFLEITPDEYKDQEYYREMCNCNFNCGMKLVTNKGKIMNSIPQEIVTQDFVVDLLVDDLDNVARFNEKALETKIPFNNTETKIWQFVVNLNGYLIENIDLNDERVEYFLNNYGEYSNEYALTFEDKYKSYIKKKNG